MTAPAEPELGRAEQTTGGAPSTTAPPTRMQLLEAKAVLKGTLRGFAAVKLPNGLVVNDVVLGESDGRQWAFLPSKAMLDRDGNLLRDPGGRPRYVPVVEWADAALRQEFSRRVVALVCAAHPDFFDA
jgi:hypothetical protein